MSSSPSLIKTTIVQAGAGTGKTESLAERIINLAQLIYEQKKTPPKFVATTFTERATSELRERVVSLLSKKTDVPPWLSDFVQDTENLHISTIHGTLSLLLHRFGGLLGLDPEFKILDAAEERDLLSRLLREVLASNPELSLLLEEYTFSELIETVKLLSAHKRLHGENFKAASGWREIFEKEKKILIENLSLIKAADVGSLTPKQAEGVLALQKIANLKLNENEDFEKVRALFLAGLEGVKKPQIKEGGRGSDIKPVIDMLFSELRDGWSEESYDPSINKHSEEVNALLTKLVDLSLDRFQDQKKEEGVLTFDDLEFLASELVVKHPEALQSIRQEWDFWFIDEFQDTSPLQKKLLFQFFRTPWNAYFVGDPQQSIYLFRGADEHVFQETKALVQKTDGVLDRLKVNFRSHPDLLGFMNQLFASMKNPLEPLLARPKVEGEVYGTARADIHLLEKDVDENQIILYQVAQWRKQGHFFHDMAVLVRTNERAKKIARHLSAGGVPVYIHSSGGYYDRREVLDALALLSFIEDPSDDDTFVILARSPWIGVEDTLLAEWGSRRGKKSFWEWLGENEAEGLKVSTLKKLKEAVDKAETRPLSAVFETLVDQLGFLEFCLQGDASGRREANLRKLFWTLRNAELEPGFSAALFIESAWTEYLDTGEETEAASFIEPQRVNIMTIHKSKGLKFNCVIVPRCGDIPKPKAPPLERAPDGQWSLRVLAADSEEKISPLAQVSLREARYEREFAESARVFYVAVTRAAEKLALVATVAPKEKNGFKSKSWFGGVGLSLTEGSHDGYIVSRWTENPEVPPLKSETESSSVREIKLPERAASVASNLTVTGLVHSRFTMAATAPKTGKKQDFSSFEFKLETQQRGQAIHSIFEEYKYHPQLGVKRLCELARARFPARLKIDEVLIERALNLQTPPLKSLIKNGFTEWGFMFRENGITLEGKVDLWGEENGITWIVDYKSAEAFTPEALAKAKEQLELYALAINKAGQPWEGIKLAVVAPLQAENVRVLPLSNREEVVARLVPLKVQNWFEVED